MKTQDKLKKLNKKLGGKSDESEDRLYKEFLVKEIKSKLVDKINNNDPQVMKTLKVLMQDKKEQKKEEKPAAKGNPLEGLNLKEHMKQNPK